MEEERGAEQAWRGGAKGGGSGMGSYDVANRYLNLEGLNLFVDP